MLKIKHSSNLEDLYYKIIAKSKADKLKGLTFEEYYNKHYKKYLIYDLKDILCGNLEKLVEIKEFHKTKYRDDNKIKRFFNYDKAKTIKFNGVKKETLISLILDHQRANVDTALDTKTESFMEDGKPKRTRIVPEKKVPIQKAVKNTLFETEEIVAKTNIPTENTAAETLPIPNKEEPSSTQDIESVD